MARRYALDASALLAFLQDEAGAQAVEDLLVSADTEVYISVINLGEALYVIQRSHGEASAMEVEARLLETPKVRVIEVSWPRAKSAAGIKAGGGLSYADSFAAALALELEAALVTKDADFRRVESDGLVRLAWLR